MVNAPRQLRVGPRSNKKQANKQQSRDRAQPYLRAFACLQLGSRALSLSHRRRGFRDRRASESTAAACPPRVNWNTSRAPAPRESPPIPLASRPRPLWGPALDRVPIDGRVRLIDWWVGRPCGALVIPRRVCSLLRRLPTGNHGPRPPVQSLTTTSLPHADSGQCR